MSRYQLRQFDAALIAFKTAVQCDPKMIRAHLALAELYLVLHNDAQALQAYKEAIALENRNASALRGAASIYLKNENNEAAVPLLETLTSAEPGDWQAQVDLGAAYAATGRRDPAEARFRQALRLRPDDASALTGLGNLLEREGQDEQAVTVLRKAIAIAPQAFEPRFVLGSAYNRLGRHAEARTELETALRLGGAQSPEVYYQLARTYADIGLDDQRRAMLAKFSELTAKAKTASDNQRSVARLSQEAESHIDAGDLRAALEKLAAAQAMEPERAHLLFRLAGVQYDLKDYASARASIQHAIRIAPSEWAYHFLLGLTEADSGRLLQARDSLQVALQLNPSATQVQEALIKVNGQLHNSAR